MVAVPRPDADGDLHLRALLAARRAGPADARHALVAATATLAEVLDLRVELLEVGMSGALRARAEPGSGAGAPVRIAAVEAPSAVLGLVDDDAALDRVEAWATLGLDRARLRDRLAELRLAPWADLGGDGALLRAAALRASLERLVAATAELDGAPPDLVILAGGAWSSIPASAALLVLADAVRRPGVVQVALDSARLLAPLGTIEDAAERARILGDLVPDALVPLGTLAIARGVRTGRQVGQLRMAVGDAPVDLQLSGGRLALVDLPPGQSGAVELAFRAPVDLGVRGKRFALRATGGLAGFVVDLRDVPLRLPERTEARREVLGSWEAALWPERDSVSGSPFVAIRPLLVAEPRVRIPLLPGDRIVASAGATVAAGGPARGTGAGAAAGGGRRRSRLGLVAPGRLDRRGARAARNCAGRRAALRARGPAQDRDRAAPGPRDGAGGRHAWSRSARASRSSSSSRASGSRAPSSSAIPATVAWRCSPATATGGSRSRSPMPARSSSSPVGPTRRP